MNLELKDKIVVVTGSAHGLGKGICKKFLEEGAIVTVTDIIEERTLKTYNEFVHEFGSEKLIEFTGDLTNEDVINIFFEKVINKFGKIDILIANLGTGRGSTDWNVSEDEWNKNFELNFNGARKITNAVIPILQKNNSGSIIYISSIAGVEVIGAPIHYSVAKAALIAYSKNLSKKIAVDNIRVNTICPGNIYFKDGTWDLKMQENEEKVIEMLKKSVPLNRFATPEDIASLVVFISSKKASFVTGACLISDGGQTIGI